MTTMLIDTRPYDFEAVLTEVRVFHGPRLLAIELCHDEREVSEVVDRWQGHPGISVLVDAFVVSHTPDDSAPEPVSSAPGWAEAGAPIARMALPGKGLE